MLVVTWGPGDMWAGREGGVKETLLCGLVPVPQLEPIFMFAVRGVGVVLVT